MANNHVAKSYYSLDQLLKEMGAYDNTHGGESRKRYWTRRWKTHAEKNGNVPLVLKCALCSGKEFARDVKAGRYKVRTRFAKKDLRNQIRERD